MEQVMPGVRLVAGENKGRFPFAHSLFLEGDFNLLIDTGAGSGLEQLAGRVERICLTHYHRDHVMGNALFPKCDFRIHALDASGVKSLQGFFALSGLDRISGDDYTPTIKPDSFRPLEVNGFLEEGMRIDLGAISLKVLHTPGHTPGHCAFLIEEYEAVFAADIDLTPFGPWYGNPTSNPADFKRSIQRIRDLKPSLLLTSHGDPVTEAIDLRLTEYAAVIDRREEKLYRTLASGPKTLDQLVDLKIIFGRHPYPKQLYRFFESNMILRHLEAMLDRSLIRVQDGGKLYEAL